MRVLMIDDDAELTQLMQQILLRSGIELCAAMNGEAGLTLLKQAPSQQRFDVVLLDVMLPGASGFDILQRIRLTSDVVVIMLTAKGDERDKVLGLDLGADDYLSKPFGAEELVARMRAILRRTKKNQVNSTICVDDVELHPSRNEVSVAGKAVSLTGVETVILKMLMSRVGEPVSREHLYRTVLNREPMPFDRSLDTHVSTLRKKLGPSRSGSHRILSVRGVGYQYAA